MGTKFSDFMRGIEEEARAEGPDAVAELRALRAHYALGRQLAHARQLQKLTQREVARRAHVDQPQVSDIERGTANPTFSTLSAVAAALGLEIALKPVLKSAPLPKPARAARPRQRVRRIEHA